MRYSRTIYICAAFLALVSCVKDEFGVEIPVQSAAVVEEEIIPSAQVPSELMGSTTQTKSLVGANTALAFSSNFLRVDEGIESGSGNGTYTFSPWSSAMVMEGQAASPDNSANRLRALTLIPTQTYRIKGEKLSDNQYRIDNYYHTRMIGWYPQTCELAKNSDGKKIATGIDAARNADGERIYSVEGGRTFIHFKDLGIDKDVMMTDMKEAQQWHASGSNPASDFLGDGTSVYRQPFGEYTGTPSYLNFFTFRHYRSAIRLYMEADQSEQNLSMWGTILNVRILNQPTACKIRIPETVETFAEYEDGDIIWDPESVANFSINTDAMFSGDPSRENLNQKVTYPVELDGATSANRVYLGYALVEPNTPVDIELHTTSGIYSVTLNSEIVDKKTGAVRQVLDAGTFYNITMSLQTKGAITEILESMDDEIFYDLSKEETFEGKEDYTGLRYANCYIVDPKDQHVKDALTEYVERVNTDITDDALKVNKSRYDGFAFCATVIGNGAAGIISNNFVPNKAIINPYSARLIWETSLGLITNVELIHGYVRFKVKYAAATGLETVKGNALIGVYDKDNKMLWSWHVWVTDTPGEVSLSGSKFLDRNIGATVAVPNSDAQALLSYGLYYQWGRKDPSMYPPTYNYPIKSLLTSTYYDYANDPKQASEVRQYTRPTIQNSIDYPQYLILPTTRTGGNYAYNWMYDNDTDLWGESDNGTVEKTIYDPCPYGYRVPGGEFKTAVDAIRNNAVKTGYGWNYNDGQFFLPYTGFKGEDVNSNSVTCSWLDVGRRGDYPTARVQRSGNDLFHRERLFISKDATWSYYIGDRQNTYSNNYYAYYTNRRTASPVRCVKDENIAGVITTSISINMPQAHKAIGLVAGDELSITCSASTTGNSSITSLSLLLHYDYDGEPRTINVANITGDFGSSVQRTNAYTVEDKDFLSHIVESGYTFEVVATNNLGRRASSNSNIKRQVFSITNLAPENIVLGVNTTKQLTPTTIPGNLSEGVVRYVVADESIASVSASGLISGVDVGETEVTADIPSTDSYTGIGSVTLPVSVVVPDTRIRYSSPTWHSSYSDGKVYAGSEVTFYFETYDPQEIMDSYALYFGDTQLTGIVFENLGTVTADGYAQYTAKVITDIVHAGTQNVSIVAYNSGNELVRASDTLVLDEMTMAMAALLRQEDFYNRDTNTYTFYISLDKPYANANFGNIRLMLDGKVLDDYWGNKPATAPQTVIIGGKTYYKFTYSANSYPSVGVHDLSVVLVDYSNANLRIESNHISFEFRYKYWIKATNADELDGKTAVIVYNGKMIANTGNNAAPAFSGTFDANKIDFDNYTYRVTKNNDGSFTFASRANTSNLLCRNEDRVRVSAVTGNVANWTLTARDESFSLKNNSAASFWGISFNYNLYIDQNAVSLNAWNNTAFQIWYLDFDITFEQAINGAHTGKYVYDNSGRLALTSKDTEVLDGVHTWNVVDYYNGGMIVRSYSGASNYITYRQSGTENPAVSTEKPSQANVYCTVDSADPQVVAVRNANTSVYFNNWGYVGIDNTAFGFWNANDSNNAYFVKSVF